MNYSRRWVRDEALSLRPSSEGDGMSDQPTYDERRMSLSLCPCGRSVSHPGACATAGRCLVDWRETQIAAIRERQRERKHGHELLPAQERV
jgi:hypothetical protein